MKLEIEPRILFCIIDNAYEQGKVMDEFSYCIGAEQESQRVLGVGCDEGNIDAVNVMADYAESYNYKCTLETGRDYITATFCEGTEFEFTIGFED